MKRKEPKLTPVNVSNAPTVNLKFLPLVTLSYESTLELKPVPLTGSTESPGEGAGAIGRMSKAVQSARGKRAAAASIKVRSAKARTAKAKAKRARTKQEA